MVGMTEQARDYWDADYWDAEAEHFDDEPDHGLLDPGVRAAWERLLLPLMPTPPAVIADLGCGTGTLAVLLAQAGHTVRGVDLSDGMVAAARRKAAAAGMTVEFSAGDVADPPLGTAEYDVVLTRHVLWALPDPAQALGRWVGLLRRDGLLVLVEGNWSTGAGLTATESEALVRQWRREAHVVPLDDPALWGGPVDDERYLLVSPS